MGNRDTSLGGAAVKFADTVWGMIERARDDSPAVRQAGLDELARSYWKPVYHYLRVAWAKSNEDAKDLTQGFFARALEKDFFAAYDPERGSFRTYLRTCLDRYVANEKKAATREKRSPGAPLLSLDFAEADAELGRSEPADGRTPEQTFHDEFIRSLFGLAVERLRTECALRGKDLPFRLFERYELDRDPDEKLTYDRLAEETNLPTTQVTNFLAFARREFRRIVLEALREITATDREFREEARRILGDPDR